MSEDTKRTEFRPNGTRVDYIERVRETPYSTTFISWNSETGTSKIKVYK